MDIQPEKQPSKIISKAAECNISRYMACLYDHDLKALVIEGEPTEDELKQAFDNISVEFLDSTGHGISYEQTLIAEIEKYDIRITVVNKCLELQKHSITFFGTPYFEAFEKLKRYGHKLTWDEEKKDKENFLTQIKSADTRDRINQVHLAIAKSKLEALREKEKNSQQNAGHISPAKSRKAFIVTLITLQKNGYVVNRETTMIEEVGLMIREHNRQVAEFKAMQDQKR